MENLISSTQLKRSDYEREQFSEDGENSKLQSIITVPPDGGWGWLVLCGCTLINFLLPGTIKSFGVLFVEYLEKFESSEAAASMIPALCYFLYCSLGPLSNYLSNKYSYRTVTLIGGSLASLGLISSYFASTLWHLCLTYGVIFGTGTGLAFAPGIFIVTSYFQKYRGLVNGIAVSGSAVGSMILPPLLRFLLENYGVNGAVLIMGAITMNVWVGALLYHPISWHMKRISTAENIENSKIIHRTQSLKDESNSSLQPDNKEELNSIDVSESIRRVGNAKLTMINDKVETVLFYSPSKKKASFARSLSPHLECRSPSGQNSSYASVTSTRSNKCSESTLSRLQPLEYASQLTLKSITESLAPRTSNGTKMSSQLVELLRTPIFIMILASNSTTIGHTIFIIFLPAYASLYYDKRSSTLLLSVVAFFDLIGRIGGSCLSDLLPFSKKCYFIVGITISGISLMLVPLAKSYLALCSTCAIFGLSSGTFHGVFVVTIVELLGEDKLASSYTASLFVNGILQLMGPPICGFFYHSSKSFEIIIRVLGVTVTMGGGIWILPLVITMRKPKVYLKQSHKIVKK